MGGAVGVMQIMHHDACALLRELDGARLADPGI